MGKRNEKKTHKKDLIEIEAHELAELSPQSRQLTCVVVTHVMSNKNKGEAKKLNSKLKMPLFEAITSTRF